MTRRIVASFLAVLVAAIALCVVPVGLRLSARERADFRQTTTNTARSVSAVVEENLSDHESATAKTPIRLPVQPGEGIVVLDRLGRRVAAVGRNIDVGTSARAAAGRPITPAGTFLATAPVAGAGPGHATVIVVRETSGIDAQIRSLWLDLGLAVVAAVSLGAVVAGMLAQWIDRPLRRLRTATSRMGDGDIAVRIPTGAGPPETRALSKAFNEMAERIGSLLDSNRAMTLDVSHQLRTPLSALRLRIELMIDDAPSRMRPELSGALREIARLNRLAEGLLAVARAEEVTPRPESVDVAAIVEQRVAVWRDFASERNVTLAVDVQPTRAYSSPGHIEQVLDNILANALDIVDDGCRVRVSARPDDGLVRIEVADNGPGMSPAHRAQAFGRFSGDRTRPGGVGLGLPIVASLIAADHGTAELTETPGGGLTVVLRLPGDRATDGSGLADVPAA